jgi:hypothetical protein
LRLPSYSVRRHQLPLALPLDQDLTVSAIQLAHRPLGALVADALVDAERVHQFDRLAGALVRGASSATTFGAGTGSRKSRRFPEACALLRDLCRVGSATGIGANSASEK